MGVPLYWMEREANTSISGKEHPVSSTFRRLGRSR
jgi:hypothetical protein